jgi:hypothetical protein
VAYFVAQKQFMFTGYSLLGNHSIHRAITVGRHVGKRQNAGQREYIFVSSLRSVICLFNAFSVTPDYITSNERMISE